ncbi:MAG: EAL domain-containing protein [Firmicutes bacterium]|nr:EAL domain-containing protein [Bacillota bacterium]
MQEFVAPYGGICTRLTGDIFACIVPQNKYSVNDIIKNSDLFNENYPINIDISIKVGIYQVKDRNISIRKMCDMANLAMNTIKGKYDKYYAFYDEKIGEKLRRENQIVFDMQEALKQKQFKVYFQPKFDINTNKIIGAEALVRWQHPKMGFIMPNDFIPVFEKNGFITDLDRYVWDYSCYKLSQWIKAGNAPFPISVNVSRIDFYNPNLCDILTDIVKKYDIPVHLLHLEITETAYSKNQKQLISVVEKLKKRGFIIEMADFGSGYSSLNVINEMPVDILKLDVKFLKHSSSNYHNNSILKFVINLANDLNFDVIAEGIETLHDIKTLEDNGCRYGQGYYFSKPIPEEEFEMLLSQTKVDNISSISKLSSGKNKPYNDYVKILNTVPFIDSAPPPVH